MVDEIKKEGTIENQAAEVTVEAPPPPVRENIVSDKDIIKDTGKITKIEEKAQRPIKKDYDVSQLPNQNPKYKDLLEGHEEPKKLIGRGISDVEKAILKYHDQGNIEALEEFLRIFMHFPRDLVRTAREYLVELQGKDKSGYDEERLQKEEIKGLLSIGSKMGLLFQGERKKAEMIRDILDMQLMTRKRRQV
jgi:hypothetical protein